MRWLTLESKMLSAVAYGGSKQLLYLRFRNTGEVYRYVYFPAAEYQAILGAESKGRYFMAMKDRPVVGPPQKPIHGTVEGLLVNFLDFFSLLDAARMGVTPTKTVRVHSDRVPGQGSEH